MTIQNVIEMIEVYDLPTDSLGAIQTYNERARAGKYDFAAVLHSLVGNDCAVLEDPDHARVQVGYVIQLAIEANKAGRVIEPNDLYTEATRKAHEFIVEMSWAFAKKEEDVKLDSTGKPRAKKGAKQVMAYEVYCEIFNSKKGISEPDAETRKEIIQAFQDDVNMSKAGATTYFYNMKKKYEAENE